MSKKDYRDYPDKYFEIIEQFSASGEDVVIKGTFSSLFYVRHDFHRFMGALSLAKERGDRYAADLVNVTRDMFLVIEPTRARRDAPASLTVKMNPMTKVILRENPSLPPKE